MSVKKKAAAAVIGLTVTGALFAGAASDSFVDHVKAGVAPLIGKVAAWAGYQVADNAEKKEDEVNAHVKSEYQRGKTEVGNAYSKTVADGNAQINSYAEEYKKAITAATNENTALAKSSIQEKVTKEVSDAKLEIDSDAKATVDQLIRETNSSIPAPPTSPER
ncbi:hypothetical protein SAMN04488137_2638 [Fictibacillus solisalsi]|uniref:Gas vesicle protein n=1 Tax=Fictibacillus solisalsi TaxID=459525 RepID=A0A1G9X8L6_9BACL|nr:hypothetical protein [Fictibacillus solisalsi]SDM93068.1 hypothetical protein SAMN04488137_2638 [Fictibacillus solisalsi]